MVLLAAFACGAFALAVYLGLEAHSQRELASRMSAIAAANQRAADRNAADRDAERAEVLDLRAKLKASREANLMLTKTCLEAAKMLKAGESALAESAKALEKADRQLRVKGAN